MQLVHVYLAFLLLTPNAEARWELHETRTNITAADLETLQPGSRLDVLSEEEYGVKLWFNGILLKTSKEGIVLVECERSRHHERAVPGLSAIPYVGHLFRDTVDHADAVPIQWIAVRRMTSLRLARLPQDDYVAIPLDIDTSERSLEHLGIEFDSNLFGGSYNPDELCPAEANAVDGLDAEGNPFEGVLIRYQEEEPFLMFYGPPAEDGR